MDLKIDDLKAFLITYKDGTFSKAAQSLGLSQSALSQKIARIENTLQTVIFIRHPRSLELTTAGEELLLYAKETVQKQKDFLEEFDQYGDSISGVIRIAAFSSIMRSRVLKKLAPFIKKNPKAKIEFKSYEVYELEEVLKTNKADLIITDYFPKLRRAETIEIGCEEYVIIESSKSRSVPNTFIDHGVFDNATESYFDYYQMDKDYERIFVGDVYAIIDAVEYGIGKAVMSRHLVEGAKTLKIQAKRKKYLRPLVLSHLKQNYYSPLHVSICEELRDI